MAMACTRRHWTKWGCPFSQVSCCFSSFSSSLHRSLIVLPFLKNTWHVLFFTAGDSTMWWLFFFWTVFPSHLANTFLFFWLACFHHFSLFIITQVAQVGWLVDCCFVCAFITDLAFYTAHFPRGPLQWPDGSELVDNLFNKQVVVFIFVIWVQHFAWAAASFFAPNGACSVNCCSLSFHWCTGRFILLLFLLCYPCFIKINPFVFISYLHIFLEVAAQWSLISVTSRTLVAPLSQVSFLLSCTGRLIVIFLFAHPCFLTHISQKHDCGFL